MSTQIEVSPKCPRCQSDRTKPLKSWNMKSPKNPNHTLNVTLMLCQNCGNKFRHVQKQ